MPTGIWWDYAVKHIPNLLLVYREAPERIFGYRITFEEHKSDIARLEAVLVLDKSFSYEEIVNSYLLQCNVKSRTPFIPVRLK